MSNTVKPSHLFIQDREDPLEFQRISDLKLINGQRFYQVEWQNSNKKSIVCWQSMESLSDYGAELMRFETKQKGYVRRLEEKYLKSYASGKAKGPLVQLNTKQIMQESNIEDIEDESDDSVYALPAQQRKINKKAETKKSKSGKKKSKMRKKAAKSSAKVINDIEEPLKKKRRYRVKKDKMPEQEQQQEKIAQAIEVNNPSIIKQSLTYPEEEKDENYIKILAEIASMMNNHKAEPSKREEYQKDQENNNGQIQEIGISTQNRGTKEQLTAEMTANHINFQANDSEISPRQQNQQLAHNILTQEQQSSSGDQQSDFILEFPDSSDSYRIENIREFIQGKISLTSGQYSHHSQNIKEQEFSYRVNEHQNSHCQDESQVSLFDRFEKFGLNNCEEIKSQREQFMADTVRLDKSSPKSQFSRIFNNIISSEQLRLYGPIPILAVTGCVKIDTTEVFAVKVGNMFDWQEKFLSYWTLSKFYPQLLLGFFEKNLKIVW